MLPKAGSNVSATIGTPAPCSRRSRGATGPGCSKKPMQQQRPLRPAALAAKQWRSLHAGAPGLVQAKHRAR